MPAALADNAAALAEGYVRTQVDYGASAVQRYLSRYEKAIDCDGTSGCIRQVQGRGDNVQATADANALASLNAVRGYVYGTDATNVNKGAKSGSTLVVGRH
jgi:hypothetical protein